MSALRSAAGPDRQQVITDLLETITFWYLKTEKATVARRPDKTYEVTLVIQASKARSDNTGREQRIDMGPEMLDVGVLDAQGAFIYLRKHPIVGGANTVTVAVDKEPVQAGVDPRHLRMDRNLDDNLVAVRPK
jgi:hypothetical protein